MKKLIGREILIKKHLEFRNDGTPPYIENVKGRINAFNEVHKQFHVETEDGYYYEVKRHSFTMLKI